MSELESLFNKADEQKAPNVFKKMFYLRFLPWNFAKIFRVAFW